MKKENAFTLIELLAVIVILAVIALIATPLVMNTIEDSKKASFKVSIQNMLHAVELEQANQDYPALSYTFPLASNSTLKLDGDISNWSGSTSIDQDGSIVTTIHNGTYCAYQRKNQDEVIIKKENKEECLLERERDEELFVWYEGNQYTGGNEWKDLSGNNRNGKIKGATFNNDHFVFDGNYERATRKCLFNAGSQSNWS